MLKKMFLIVLGFVAFFAIVAFSCGGQEAIASQAPTAIPTLTSVQVRQMNEATNNCQNASYDIVALVQNSGKDYPETSRQLFDAICHNVFVLRVRDNGWPSNQGEPSESWLIAWEIMKQSSAAGVGAETGVGQNDLVKIIMGRISEGRRNLFNEQLQEIINQSITPEP
jgi:hypothetical protein